jgi:hypothetical protein
MADCPENIHIFVIIPTQYFTRKSPWDTQLESTCSSHPRYSTFFEKNVHLFKIGIPRYAQGGLQTVANILGDLETIKENELVVWVPILSKLEKHWDTHVLKDWGTITRGSSGVTEEGLSQSASGTSASGTSASGTACSSTLKHRAILSYPLQTVPSLEQDIEGYLFQREITSTPSYYFINSFFNLECRSFAKTDWHRAPPIQSLYVSFNYPVVMINSSLQQMKEIIHTEDLQFSFALARQSYNIFIGMHSIGFTYRKNTSSVPIGLNTTLEQSLEFREWAEKIGIQCILNQGSMECKILLHGKMGTGKDVPLQEKIIKWGTEIKYQTFREALLSDDG